MNHGAPQRLWYAAAAAVWAAAMAALLLLFMSEQRKTRRRKSWGTIGDHTGTGRSEDLLRNRCNIS